MKQKVFTIKRFGFKFNMFINNKVVVACIIRLPGDSYDRTPVAFIGTAKVNKPDIYNYEIGKRVAIKSAINQYSSFVIGKETLALNGLKSQMKQANKRLQSELNNLRR